ncbi:MAG: mechanosensitive ion channel family protein [Flavobacteriales bacterium]
MPVTPLRQALAANTVEDWLWAAAFAGGGWLLGQAISRLSAALLKPMAKRTASRLDDALVEQLRAPLVVLVTVLGFAAGLQHLSLGERLDQWAARVLHVAVALSATWIVARAAMAIVDELLLARTRAQDQQARPLPGVRAVIRLLIWGLGIVLALNNAGYDVGALLAGIGIGGLAMALAAQETVANVFGGITIYADRPFAVGDRVRVDGHDGFVKDIGMRSTRIQSLAGPIVVIPNKKFTESIIENVSAEPARRMLLELGLVYETPPAKMERAMEVLREIVRSNRDILEEDHIVSFNTFKEYSLNILFVCFIRKGADIFDAHSRINMAILRRFNEEGLSFAYPTAVELQGEYKPLA